MKLPLDERNHAQDHQQPGKVAPDRAGSMGGLHETVFSWPRAGPEHAAAIEWKGQYHIEAPACRNRPSRPTACPAKRILAPAAGTLGWLSSQRRPSAPRLGLNGTSSISVTSPQKMRRVMPLLAVPEWRTHHRLWRLVESYRDKHTSRLRHRLPPVGRFAHAGVRIGKKTCRDGPHDDQRPQDPAGFNSDLEAEQPERWAGNLQCFRRHLAAPELNS